MRKLAVVLFAVGSLCLMAFPAFAEKGDMAFGVNGGLAMPMGQLADEDYADMKMGPRLRARLRLLHHQGHRARRGRRRTP